MPQELPDVKTPGNPTDLIKAFAYAWEKVFNTVPTKPTIALLLAHWAHETGVGKGCHCNNLGNFKSTGTDGRDWCYYACNEVLVKAEAEMYAAARPATAKITKDYGNGKVLIWFYPKHPGCRFRAFDTLAKGAIDYLASLYKRFNKAWPAVLAGDPRQFSHLLRAQGYYTADEDEYTRALVWFFGQYMKLDMEGYLQLFTADETEDVLQMVALTLEDMSDAELEKTPGDGSSVGG